MPLPNVSAVIVAVEDYHLGKDWELSGPCDDAVALAGWLLQIGVPKSNIRMLATALATNAQKFQETLTTLGLPVPGVADTSAVIDLLTSLPTALPAAQHKDGLLIVYWTGHGVFDSKQAPPQRNVFFSDLDPLRTPVLALDSAARWLRFHLPHLSVAFVIDACALHKEEMNIQHALHVNRLPDVALTAHCAKFLGIYSCSEGQVALNLGKGVFSTHLLAELAGFKPETVEDFLALDSVIRATRERVLLATNGVQRVQDEEFVDWNGHTAGPLRPDVPSARMEELDVSAANLCDRDDQWGSFKELALSQVGNVLANRVVVVAAHGMPEQDPDAFFEKVKHRMERERDAFHHCATVSGPHCISLSLSTSFRPEWLRSAFRRQLMEKLVITPTPIDEDEQLRAIATCINRHDRAYLFTAHVQAGLLLKHKDLFKEIREFWKSLPVIGSRSLAVFALFVRHDECRWPAWLQWLPLSKAGNARAAKQLRDEGFLVEPELNSVGREHLYSWVNEMYSLNPRWRRLSETELDQVCPRGKVHVMGKIVESLRGVLNNRLKPLNRSGG